jgi:hypothetical protein
MIPAGAMSTRALTSVGNISVKLAAMPPPREYPTRQKALSPVHERGDVASTLRIWVI